MLIFLYGPDTYRSRQKLHTIVGRYKKIHKSELNLRIFDEENLDFQSFKDTVRTVSMFAEKKLVVVENVFSNKSFQADFLQNPEEFINSEDVIVFYQKKAISKKDSFFDFLSKNAETQEFNFFSSQQLKKWAQQQLDKFQAKIEPLVLNKLVDYVGKDLWRFSNEIKKLVDYRNGNPIRVSDVELLVRPKIETDIFKTIDALGNKNKKKALGLIYKHLDSGDSPFYLLSMINYQFRNLLEVKDFIERHATCSEIISQSSLHPFVARKSYQSAQKFTIEQLKGIFRRLFLTDYRTKLGKIEPGLGLDMLIVSI